MGLLLVNIFIVVVILGNQGLTDQLFFEKNDDFGSSFTTTDRLLTGKDYANVTVYINVTMPVNDTDSFNVTRSAHFTDYVNVMDNVNVTDCVTVRGYANVTDYANDTSNNWTEQESHSDHTTTVMSTVAIIVNGIISKETYESFEHVAGYLQFFLIVVGIVVNVFNIVVFTQKGMRSPTSTILTCLSCSEMGFAISELILSSSKASLGAKSYSSSKLYWTLLRWLRVFVGTVFQRSSFCFNLSVATERFIAVSFPFKSNRILRQKNPVVFCFVLFFAILAIHIFNPLKMDVVCINIGNQSIHVIRNSQLYNESPDFFEGVTISAKVIFAYIPLFGCLLMNILMVVALKKHSKNRKMLQNSIEGHQQNDRHEVQTTITVLVSSLLFVLLSLPVTTHSIVQKLDADYASHKKEHYLYSFITYLFGLFSLLSLSMDFVVYMILGRAFRRTFFNLARSVYRTVFSCRPGSNLNSSTDIPTATIMSELDNNSMESYVGKYHEETDTNM